LVIRAAQLVEVEVVEVVQGHLKSLKVALVIEAGSICSEKVALTLAPREAPFVPLADLAVSTFGGVLSMLTVPEVGLPCTGRTGRFESRSATVCDRVVTIVVGPRPAEKIDLPPFS
jgi:hypothetical protein